MEHEDRLAGDVNIITCLLCDGPLAVQVNEFGVNEQSTGVCHECARKLITHIALKCDKCGSISFLKKTPENFARLNAVLAEGFQWEDFMSSILVIMAAYCPDCHSWENEIDASGPIQ